MTIKAIQTKYNDNFFRSRIEARWAVFFKTLGVTYEYEKEGYQLTSSLRYLPDFWLPEQEYWREIKGTNPTQKEKQKMALLTEGTGKDGYILSGDIGEKKISLTNFDLDDGYLKPLYDVWIVYGNIESYSSDFILSFWTGEIIDFLKSKHSKYSLGEIPNKIESIKDVQKAIVADKRYYRQKHRKEHTFYTCNNLCYSSLGGMGWSYRKEKLELGAIDFRSERLKYDQISHAYRAARSARFEHGETP